MAGVDIRTVAELMGHRTLAMTKRYAHLAPAHNLAAVEKLAAYAPASARRPGVVFQVQTAARTATSRKAQPVSH